MSKRDKLRNKIRNNPNAVSFQDLETLMLNFEFTRVRVTGSHFIYQYREDEISKKITIPIHGSQVKSPYVKRVLEIIDRIHPEVE